MLAGKSGFRLTHQAVLCSCILAFSSVVVFIQATGLTLVLGILKMNREEPYFAKCCYVIPLRFCLQTWAVIKLVADLISIVGAIVAIAYFLLVFCMTSTPSHVVVGPLLLMILFVLLTIAICIDFGFTVTLIIGVAKTNQNLLQITYVYNIYLIIMETVLFTAFFIAMCFIIEIGYCVLIFVGGLLYIVLDACVILALKSEIIKIRNKKQFSFNKLPKYPTEFNDTDQHKTEEI